MPGDQVVSVVFLQGALELAEAMDKARIKYALIGGLLQKLEEMVAKCRNGGVR